MSLAGSKNGYYEIEAPIQSNTAARSDNTKQLGTSDGDGGEDRPLSGQQRQEVQNLLFTVMIGEVLLAVIGIALSASLGYTITGGILTGCACFLSIVFIAAYLLFRFAAQSAKTSLLPDFSLSKAIDLLKILLPVSVAMLVIAIGTIIQGSVVLGQTTTMSIPFLPYMDPYMYHGIMSFYYVRLGSANVGLGVMGAVIEAVLIYRAYVVLRRLRSESGGSEVKNGVVDIIKSLTGEKSNTASRTTSPLPTVTEVEEPAESVSGSSDRGSAVSSSVRYLEIPAFRPAQIARSSPSATSV